MMKTLILGTSLLVASVGGAQDVSQILNEQQCVFVQNEKSAPVYECEGSLAQVTESQSDSLSVSNEPLTLDEGYNQKLKMNLILSLNGQVVARPQIVAALNESAQVIQKEKKSKKEYVIEVLPSLQSAKNEDDKVYMQFKVTEKSNGQSKVLSGASILAKTNQQAEIEVQVDDPRAQVKTLSIKVTPTWVESQAF